VGVYYPKIGNNIDRELGGKFNWIVDSGRNVLLMNLQVYDYPFGWIDGQIMIDPS
jgi:hypothetical protein